MSSIQGHLPYWYIYFLYEHGNAIDYINISTMFSFHYVIMIYVIIRLNKNKGHAFISYKIVLIAKYVSLSCLFMLRLCINRDT